MGLLSLGMVLALVGIGQAFDLQMNLASKTNYKYRTPMPDAPFLNKTADPPNCKARFLYLVSRHGTRFISQDHIDEMKQLEKIFQKAPNADQYPWMKNWTVPFPDVLENDLSPIGQEEMFQLAKRLKARFPDLLSDPYSTGKYFFRSTQKVRTSESAISFGIGLFGGDGGMNGNGVPGAIGITQEPKDADPLLRFYKTNLPYSEKADEYEDLMDEWVKDTYYKDLARKIEKRLGLKKHSIRPHKVAWFYTACQAEAYLLETTDETCTIFTQDELELFEYIEDMENYLEGGPAFELNGCIAKPLLNDMVKRFEEVAYSNLDESDSVSENARFHFAHSETLMHFGYLLGLDALNPDPGNDTQNGAPFPAPPEEKSSRFWSSSRIIPMGANVVGVLYDCDDGIKVRIVWNEQVLSGPWCGGKADCALEEFVGNVEQAANSFGECNYGTECSFTCSPNPETRGFC